MAMSESKRVKVYINGREHHLATTMMSYELLVEMSGYSGHPSATMRNLINGDQRIVAPGALVTLDPGHVYVFNVIHTGNA